jgi:hypothetical protein
MTCSRAGEPACSLEPPLKFAQCDHAPQDSKIETRKSQIATSFEFRFSSSRRTRLHRIASNRWTMELSCLKTPNQTILPFARLRRIGRSRTDNMPLIRRILHTLWAFNPSTCVVTYCYHNLRMLIIHLEMNLQLRTLRKYSALPRGFWMQELSISRLAMYLALTVVILGRYNEPTRPPAH